MFFFIIDKFIWLFWMKDIFYFYFAIFTFSCCMILHSTYNISISLCTFFPLQKIPKELLWNRKFFDFSAEVRIWWKFLFCLKHINTLLGRSDFVLWMWSSSKFVRTTEMECLPWIEWFSQCICQIIMIMC